MTDRVSVIGGCDRLLEVSMPNYWFTTHWPPYEQGGPDTLNIYIQDQFRAELEEMDTGDKVFVYQFKSGPKVTNAQGEVIHRRQPGKEGIVCEARLSSGLHLRPGYVPEYFEGRGKRNFCWQALTDERIFGFVPRIEVNKVLGFEPGYLFFGFNGGRGIKKISSEEYAKLHDLLIAAGR